MNVIWVKEKFYLYSFFMRFLHFRKDKHIENGLKYFTYRMHKPREIINCCVREGLQRHPLCLSFSLRHKDIAKSPTQRGTPKKYKLQIMCYYL